MLDYPNIALIIAPLMTGFLGAGEFPKIIRLSYKRKFYKASNSRTVDDKYVSTLEGISIF